MYQEYFQLKENPFALTPDPRFLFLSHQHREALAHLLFGMGEMGGFVQVTGEVGTGKTTLCRSLLEQVPHLVNVALILNPKQNSVELMASICDELKVTYPEGTTSTKVLVDGLNRHLLAAHAAGWRTVLVIDEAQNLSAEVLEQIRLLTNLETTTHKLLQILLLGQPELKSLMERPELRQLSQRVTARYHLMPLRVEETVAYIQHRLEIAGCHRPLFSASAMRLVHRLSGGIPRLINIICDRSLLGAYARRQMQAGKPLIRKAAEEVTGKPAPRRRLLLRFATAGLICLLAVVSWRFLPASLWQGLKTTISRQTPGEISSPAENAPPATGKAAIPDTETSDLSQKAPAEPSDEPLAGDSTPILPKITADDIPPALEPVSLITEPSTAAGVDWAGASNDVLAATAPETTQPVDRQAAADMPKRPGFADLIGKGWAATDTQTAFAALFKYWGADYGQLTGATACERAKSAGLRCFHDRGNWNTLYIYNRPAVLELVDEERKLHDVVLVGMQGEDVVLDFEGEQAVFARSEVEPYWFGEFILFWKPPSADTAVLGKRSVGPEVKRLRQWLDRAEGIESGSGVYSGVFDDALEQRVIRFQKYHRLTPDGLVGEQTWLLLNTAAGEPPSPALRPLAE